MEATRSETAHECACEAGPACFRGPEDDETRELKIARAATIAERREEQQVEGSTVRAPVAARQVPMELRARSMVERDESSSESNQPQRETTHAERLTNSIVRPFWLAPLQQVQPDASRRPRSVFQLELDSAWTTGS